MVMIEDDVVDEVMMATTMMRTKMVSVMAMNVMGMMRTKMLTKAGAISESVDILTAPSRETRRSNQGTVAAKPTENPNFDFDLKIIDNGLL